MERINFNNYIIAELPPAYSGSDTKITLDMDLNGEKHKYLLKLPDASREAKSQVSYINNAISEYIGCKIFEQIGIPVQEVTLGEYTTEDGKVKVACACRDFLDENNKLRLHEAKNWDIRDTKRSSRQKRNITFESIETLAGQIKWVDKENILERYYDTFVVDALIGNTDRHNGNWGIIISYPELQAQMAPVYDCASSMCPLFADQQLTKNETRRQALNVLCAVSDENGHRYNYRDYILSGKNENVNKALLRVVPKINVKEIHGIIRDIPYISKNRKNFYCDLIDIKYQEILVPALKNILDKNLSYNLDEDRNYNFKLAKDDIFKATDKTPVFEDGEINTPGGSFLFTKVRTNMIMIRNEDESAKAILSTKKDSKSVPQFIAALNLEKAYELRPLINSIEAAEQKASEISNQEKTQHKCIDFEK